METRKPDAVQLASEGKAISPSRRTALPRLGRFAAITPPAVTLLLSALSKSAASAITSGAPISSRQFKEPVSIPQLRKRA